MSTAFEVITSRIGWHAAEKIDRAYGAELDADGKFAKATAAGKFAGVVQYGAAEEDDMCTVVTGIVQAVAGGAIAAGSQVEISAAAAGVFITLANGTAVGRALSAAGAAGELFALYTYKE